VNEHAAEHRQVLIKDPWSIMGQFRNAAIVIANDGTRVASLDPDLLLGAQVSRKSSGRQPQLRLFSDDVATAERVPRPRHEELAARCRLSPNPSPAD
jgi:hypothetical protein